LNIEEAKSTTVELKDQGKANKSEDQLSLDN